MLQQRKEAKEKVVSIAEQIKPDLEKLLYDLSGEKIKRILASVQRISDGYTFTLFDMADGPPKIVAGCRFMTIDAYAAHVAKEYPDTPKARELDQPSLAWAQDHLRILSGFYGLLRPLDRIQPYRLEMGTRLKTRRGSSLYDFWGDRISKCLNADAEGAMNAKDALGALFTKFPDHIRDIDDMLERDYPAFEALAKQWRAEHPADVMFSLSSSLAGAMNNARDVKLPAGAKATATAAKSAATAAPVSVEKAPAPTAAPSASAAATAASAATTSPR